MITYKFIIWIGSLIVALVFLSSDRVRFPLSNHKVGLMFFFSINF
jgi:hypothetical protein